MTNPANRDGSAEVVQLLPEIQSFSASIGGKGGVGRDLGLEYGLKQKGFTVTMPTGDHHENPYVELLPSDDSNFAAAMHSDDQEPGYDVTLLTDGETPASDQALKNMALQAPTIDPVDGHKVLTDEQMIHWNAKFDSSPAAWGTGVAEIVETLGPYQAFREVMNGTSISGDVARRKFPGVFKSADALEVFCAGMRTKKAAWMDKANDPTLTAEKRAGYTAMVNMLDNDEGYKLARGMHSYYKELELALGHGMSISGEKASIRMLTHHVLLQFGYNVGTAEKAQNKALEKLNTTWQKTINDYDSAAPDQKVNKPTKEAYDHAIRMQLHCDYLKVGGVRPFKKTSPDLLNKYSTSELKSMRSEKFVDDIEDEINKKRKKIEELEKQRPPGKEIGSLNAQIQKLESKKSAIPTVQSVKNTYLDKGLHRAVFQKGIFSSSLNPMDGKSTHMLGKYSRRGLSNTGWFLDKVLVYGTLGVYKAATGGRLLQSALTYENYTAGDTVSCRLKGSNVDLSLDAASQRRENSFLKAFKSRWNSDPSVTITSKDGLSKVNMKLNHSIKTLNDLDQAQRNGAPHPKYARLQGDMSRFVDVALRKGLGSSKETALKITSTGKAKTKGTHDIYRRMAFTDLKARAMAENKTLYAVNEAGFVVPITPTHPDILLKNSPNSPEALFIKNELMTIKPGPDANKNFSSDLTHFLEQHGGQYQKHLDAGFKAVEESVTATFTEAEQLVMENAELEQQIEKLKADQVNLVEYASEAELDALSPEEKAKVLAAREVKKQANPAGTVPSAHTSDRDRIISEARDKAVKAIHIALVNEAAGNATITPVVHTHDLDKMIDCVVNNRGLASDPAEAASRKALVAALTEYAEAASQPLAANATPAEKAEYQAQVSDLTGAMKTLCENDPSVIEKVFKEVSQARSGVVQTVTAKAPPPATPTVAGVPTQAVAAQPVDVETKFDENGKVDEVATPTAAAPAGAPGGPAGIDPASGPAVTNPPSGATGAVPKPSPELSPDEPRSGPRSGPGAGG